MADSSPLVISFVMKLSMYSTNFIASFTSIVDRSASISLDTMSI